MKGLHKQYFLELLRKYRENKSTPEEIKFLESYYDVFDENEGLINDSNSVDYAHLKENIKREVDLKINNRQVRVRNLTWLKYAAAAILALFSVSVYLFSGKEKQNQTAKYDEHIVPGGNKAVLTLANGQKITLNDAAKGEIARQSGISITKTADGQIIYTIAAGKSDRETKAENQQPLQNTISTPKGGQYTVVLPDGTAVRLNAASSLTYPAVFHGKMRLVHLNGEAYFEVAKHNDMPFRVQSGQQTVEVLGTHFNINAYDDENTIKTTLLEGAVKVSSARSSSVIAPGQQAVLSKSGDGTIFKRSVNTGKEIAWKDGLFSFENDDIKTVMRSIARWYNVDVRYSGAIQDIVFSGEIFRTAKLSEVLKILELSNVQLDVQDKTIVVSMIAEQ